MRPISARTLIFCKYVKVKLGFDLLTISTMLPMFAYTSIEMVPDAIFEMTLFIFVTTSSAISFLGRDIELIY